ncbi:nodulation-signaling pathway 1 protein [Olea europaea var. sylvestris]|uniref:nodulation-signaling pathway 1 protein n=1 Tax=Olea europaea var. sylvestris TaxID=158386 RepID=UPI000C1CD503|nr:nodulation-signaling pathway 1 protein [Olea europaea var. sylvestris]
MPSNVSSQIHYFITSTRSLHHTLCVHLNLSLPSTPTKIFSTMTLDEPEPNPAADHILEWLEGSLSYFPSFLDDPYDATDFSADSWWVQTQCLDQEPISQSPASFNNSIATTATTTINTKPMDSSVVSNQPMPPDLPKKRKLPDDLSPMISQSSRKNQNPRIDEADVAGAITGQGVPPRRTAASKKTTGKLAVNTNNGNNKEGRWAEQLLNPCAAAVTAQNPSRVQHFLYVLQDLSSLTGDANHRLAAHGLQALKHHLSHPCISSAPAGSTTFASSNPKFFRDSLIKFNDINPWFRIPNNIANTSILQILAEQDCSSNLHIVDIGVSHGVQWPTLLEELTRRSGGPPPLVRLTVVAPSGDNNQSRSTPFANGPPNYDFYSQLLGFAKIININLQINRLENIPLQNLNSQVINSSTEEVLVICAQFRLHNLNHNIPDERTEFLRLLRSMEPKGVVLSENNTDCSCNNCGDFATGFSRRVEYLWKFLDSTSVAYKGRESDERRMMEAEAAKALTNVGEMNERKDKWCERMRNSGFTLELFGEETIDGARALLRKYDSNWEIRTEGRDYCVCLWWKGQPVSFCSLWKPCDS